MSGAAPPGAAPPGAAPSGAALPGAAPPGAAPDAPTSARPSPWGSRLTRYEFARLVSARTQQLSDGATTTLPDGAGPGESPHVVAVREIEAGVVPLAVQRESADGTLETLRVDQLQIPAALLRHQKAMSLLS